MFWGIVGSLLLGCVDVVSVVPSGSSGVTEAVPTAESHLALAEKPVEPLAVKVEEGVAFTSPLASGFTQRLDVYAPEMDRNWPGERLSARLVHGMSDTVNSPKQSEELYAVLDEAGYYVEIALIEGKGHTTMNVATIPIIVGLAFEH